MRRFDGFELQLCDERGLMSAPDDIIKQIRPPSLVRYEVNSTSFKCSHLQISSSSAAPPDAYSASSSFSSSSVPSSQSSGPSSDKSPDSTPEDSPASCPHLPGFKNPLSAYNHLFRTHEFVVKQFDHASLQSFISTSPTLYKCVAVIGACVVVKLSSVVTRLGRKVVDGCRAVALESRQVEVGLDSRCAEVEIKEWFKLHTTRYIKDRVYLHL